MRSLILILLTFLLSCQDKTRYCECTTQYIHNGEVYQEETNVTQYEGTEQACESVLIVPNSFGQVRIECKEVTP